MAGRKIACLWVPYFGVTVARQADGRLAGRPLVLLDEQGRVLATDGAAAAAGIAPGMGERQALARCPEARLAEAARYPIVEAQAAFQEPVKRYAERWQPAGPGCVYVDTDAPVGNGPKGEARSSRQGSGAPHAAHSPRPPGKSRAAGEGLGVSPASRVGAEDTLLRWCQALAEAVRRLGWDPALGVTGSKFGAEVAGRVAGVNTALMVAPAAQRVFLSGRPVTALPLDAETLIQLRHLGIRTLGQFARLPAAGVQVRFGPTGRTAQRWAQGLDDRPIIPPWEAPEATARIEFATPLEDRERILAALERRAGRLLLPLQEQLQAAGRVALLVTRADGRVVPGSHTFPLPTAAAATVRLGLASALDRVTWDGQGAAEITLTLAGITDAPAQQLPLFDFNSDGRARLNALLSRLAARFSPDAFRLAELSDPDNLLPERRTSWQRFS